MSFQLALLTGITMYFLWLIHDELRAIRKLLERDVDGRKRDG